MTEKNEGWQSYPASNDVYSRIRDDILLAAEELGMTPRQQLRLELGVEEIVQNIISYAYEDGGPVWIRTSADKGMFWLEIVDYGKDFNPLAKDMRHSTGVPTIDQDEGGYGIFLVKNFFPSLDYTRELFAGRSANHLTMGLGLTEQPVTNSDGEE